MPSNIITSGYELSDLVYRPVTGCNISYDYRASLDKDGDYNIATAPNRDGAYSAICNVLDRYIDKIDKEAEDKNKKQDKKNGKLEIKRIIFNEPATIIFWSDGEKTVVKAAEGDEYNPYYGFCCAVTKRIFGNNSVIKKVMKRKGNL